MQTSFKISVFVNVVLIGLMGWFAQSARPPESKPMSVPSVVANDVPPSTLVETRGEPTGAFRWSQIESPDYRTYIGNLRGIGCPERTIRDLITADVDSLYAVRRDELTRKLGAVDSFITHPNARQELETGLQGLHAEEEQVLAVLLGSEDGSTQIAGRTSAASSGEATENAPVSIPLVFQEIPPGIQLDARQIEVFNKLRQAFQADLEGTSMDRNDPAYRKSWQEAQRRNDEQLQGMLGGEFFLDYQVQVANRSVQ